MDENEVHIPLGYGNPDETLDVINKYNINNNSFANIVIQNVIAGIDCRSPD